MKREEDRIAREMAEKEEEEARAVLEQAARSGKIKLPTGDKLDKAAILNQVRSRHLLLLAVPEAVAKDLSEAVASPVSSAMNVWCNAIAQSAWLPQAELP